jgi:glycosidase
MAGNAFVYYGEELGMKGAGRDEARRAPMYWSDDPHAPGMCAGPPGMGEVRMEYGSWETQKDDPASILNYIREAVRIRESLPVIARGRTVRVPELEEDLFCGFVRSGTGGDGNFGGAVDSGSSAGDVLILINIGDTAVTRHLPDSMAEFQDLCAALYTGEENASVNGREITVPAGGILFLRKL